MVANGQSATREGRLLSWADEISALVATQRDDLRRSRMELVAAQEVRVKEGAKTPYLAKQSNFCMVTLQSL